MVWCASMDHQDRVLDAGIARELSRGARRRDTPSARALVPAFALMLAVGPSNFVLYKILFAVYGDASAFFVMQGINLLFVVYGAVGLWVVARRGGITAEMRTCSKAPFAAMAALDCLGGLCAAMGAVDTPGQLQTLLNQSLVPCTMIASTVLLGARYGRRKLFGALVILFGAGVVVAPALAGPAMDARAAASILVYWGSNVPMALSAVYKEWRFSSREDVHVMYLTQWVSTFQFLFGFAFAPLQCAPGVATREGLSLGAVAAGFIGDARDAALGADPKKSALLLAYVLNNFVLNVTGLFVTKGGGAALTAILYSVLLPLSTLAFGLPFLGPFREPIRGTTVAGLCVVLLGFYFYEADDLRSKGAARDGAPPPRRTPPTPTSTPRERTALVRSPPPAGRSPAPFVPAFHERLLLPLPVRSKGQRPHRTLSLSMSGPGRGRGTAGVALSLGRRAVPARDESFADIARSY